MPELPEVELVVRRLRPQILGRRIFDATVRRPRVVRPESPSNFAAALRGQQILNLTRRAKYLLFELESSPQGTLVGHLGMTGRFFVQKSALPLPKHTAVILHLGDDNLVFEDTRYFGRMNFETAILSALGPEPLDVSFTTAHLQRTLQSTRQPIKVCLLDQSRIAGIGNIYASEALFRAGIHPNHPADCLNARDLSRLWTSIRAVLQSAIEKGTSLFSNHDATESSEAIFYHGQNPPNEEKYKLWVYDRAGQPCRRCRTDIQRCVLASRSTYWCPKCQPA